MAVTSNVVLAAVTSIVLIGIGSSCASGSPEYCSHLRASDEAKAAADRLEARYGSNTGDWPAGDLERWIELQDTVSSEAWAIWDTAPESYDWADVRRACQ